MSEFSPPEYGVFPPTGWGKCWSCEQYSKFVAPSMHSIKYWIVSESTIPHLNICKKCNDKWSRIPDPSHRTNPQYVRWLRQD